MVVVGMDLLQHQRLEPLPPDERPPRRQAEFEKLYKKYESMKGARVTEVYADVDIHPERAARRSAAGT